MVHLAVSILQQVSLEQLLSAQRSVKSINRQRRHHEHLKERNAGIPGREVCRERKVVQPEEN